MADKPAKEKDITPRSEDLAKTEKHETRLLEVYKDVEKGFGDQTERSDDISDYWDAYNCKLGAKQFYSGNSQIFVPIVHDAVNARKTRFRNQLFPRAGRYVDCISADGTQPSSIMALAEHYVRRAKVRELTPALLKNGDIEGHYHIYVSWTESIRHIAIRDPDAPIATEDGYHDPDETSEDITHKKVRSSHPTVEVIADNDVLILPSTASSPQDALAQGGSVTIIRRWSKAKIKRMIKDEEIDEEEGEDLLAEMSTQQKGSGPTDKSKQMADAAGIRGDGKGKHCIVYETWTLLDLDDEEKICRAYFAGPDKILSCKRNPLWCDRLPLISCPVERVQGVFKGTSLLKPVVDTQYFANDMINEAADSATFAMMPIIMTDPNQNPRVGSMVLSLASVWLVDPKSTQFAKFPEIWKDGFEIVGQAKQQIFQTLSVNPAQITQSSGKAGGKRNQAEIANEQQVDIMTTADAVTVVEEGVFTPMLTLFLEMDHQYRDREISVPMYGDLGRRANMQSIPPLQMDRRYEPTWLGVEAARNAAAMQSQIAFLNVLRGIPPQFYQGYRVNLAPAIVQMVENAFGPRMAPLIFEDIRLQLNSDPEEENKMLLSGVEAFVHPMDNHVEHMKVHMQVIQDDPQKLVRAHITGHQQALAQQIAAQSQATQPQGQPGSPGAGKPGIAGQPRPGAVPGQPRGGQGPPGMIHQDRLKDPRMMPRKM